MNPPQLTLRAIIATYAALMILLVMTAVTPAFQLGEWRTGVSLLIAVTKTALIFLFFMRLRYSIGLIRVVACAGFLWLLIMGTLDFTDYLTR